MTLDGDPNDEEGRLIRAQLAALRAGPKKRLRLFRALEYVCAGCGQTILAVMKTSPYRVISCRTEAERPEDGKDRKKFIESLGRRPSPKDWAAFYREAAADRGPDRVSPDGSFYRIPDDFEEAAQLDTDLRNTEYHALCRCASWSFPQKVIANDLLAGVKKRSWTTRGDS